ncbi:hypothetical protein CROQUDRAFT_107997 [Cronartium quercuum f. sp. fusiforme G11]|uniref:Secreted protein n=1 Tax=Cronartium quercuum f. sp. fusiforme G11 TaxID=708437 RepID=A0A9P6NGJ6_9BASI|nr:hypothetical protein CROQUDRAFT_107997 [Cronartium quercuum f. sp. fusiforme G11]
MNVVAFSSLLALLFFAVSVESLVPPISYFYCYNIPVTPGSPLRSFPVCATAPLGTITDPATGVSVTSAVPAISANKYSNGAWSSCPVTPVTFPACCTGIAASSSSSFSARTGSPPQQSATSAYQGSNCVPAVSSPYPAA